MSCRRGPPRWRRLALLFLLATGLAAGAVASDPGEEAEALRQASQGDPGADPAWLREAARRFGELVVRARAERADEAAFRGLVRTGEALAERVEATRSAREDAAGDDEAALEVLLRSETWQGLRDASALLEYWTAWSRLEVALRLPDGVVERRELAQRAEAAFAASLRSLSLPGLAPAGLLGLGVARLAAGDLTGAESALRGLREALDRGEAPESLREPLVRATVQLEARRGDLEGATRAAAEAPGALSAADRRELRRFADLQAAQQALAEDRPARARELYSRVFDGSEPEGPELHAARYGYALALQGSGELEAAARQLERVLADPPTGETARDAARLRYAIAERLLAAAATPENAALAASAAAGLLEHAPDAPQADTARLRVARESAASGRVGAALRELDSVDPAGPAQPGALWERIRLRAGMLEADAVAADPRHAAALARDIDAARRLAREGRLPIPPEDSATLAVLRARAARASAAPIEDTRRWIERARSEPGLDAVGRDALLRVELGTLLDAGDFAGFARLLAERDDSEVRSAFSAFWATLLALEEQGSAGARVAAWSRLAELAPPEDRAEVLLAEARARLDAGDAQGAARQAEALVEADASWGDARWLLARALDAGDDAARAASAWSALAQRLEPGGQRWQEANLAWLRALERAGEREAACRLARSLDVADPPPPEVRATLGRCNASLKPDQGTGKP